MDEEKSVYSSVEVAKMLGLAPSYIRVVLRRHPQLVPSKVGNSWVWTQEDVDRIKEWHSRHKKAEQK